MKNYAVVEVGNYKHIVRQTQGRENTIHKEANYRGTLKGLCGVIPKRESTNKWIRNHMEKMQAKPGPVPTKK